MELGVDFCPHPPTPYTLAIQESLLWCGERGAEGAEAWSGAALFLQVCVLC